jgi:two-component system copper resistance phosphate regulon response regulator CusR
LKVLYVEDDRTTREYVARGLDRKGVIVDVAETVAEGHERALTGEYDVMIIDVMLPDGEGFGLLEGLRAANVTTPALFLSARGEVADRIRGFETGADDYLPKPFSLTELAARVRAVARRKGAPPNETLRVADLELDPSARTVSRDGRTIDLTTKQFALLEIVLRGASRVQTRASLLERIWGYDADRKSNVVDVQISYLRKKIDEGFGFKLIHTRPGQGYVLEDRRPGRESIGGPDDVA